jgi:hypothetical protein
VDPEFICDLFAPFGPVAVRRMFGGAGIYREGLMFALEFDGAIFLKVDAASIPTSSAKAAGPSSIRAPRARAKSAAPRSPIGGCRSGSTTIPKSSLSGRSARSPSPGARKQRRARRPSAACQQKSVGRIADGLDRLEVRKIKYADGARPEEPWGRIFMDKF